MVCNAYINTVQLRNDLEHEAALKFVIQATLRAPQYINPCEIRERITGPHWLHYPSKIALSLGRRSLVRSTIVKNEELYMLCTVNYCPSKLLPYELIVPFVKFTWTSASEPGKRSDAVRIVTCRERLYDSHDLPLVPHACSVYEKEKKRIKLKRYPLSVARRDMRAMAFWYPTERNRSEKRPNKNSISRRKRKEKKNRQVAQETLNKITRSHWYKLTLKVLVRQKYPATTERVSRVMKSARSRPAVFPIPLHIDTYTWTTCELQHTKAPNHARPPCAKIGKRRCARNERVFLRRQTQKPDQIFSIGTERRQRDDVKNINIQLLSWTVPIPRA